MSVKWYVLLNDLRDIIIIYLYGEGYSRRSVLQRKLLLLGNPLLYDPAVYTNAR